MITKYLAHFECLEGDSCCDGDDDLVGFQVGGDLLEHHRHILRLDGDKQNVAVIRNLE